jgi:hypothetical protein
MFVHLLVNWIMRKNVWWKQYKKNLHNCIFSFLHVRHNSQPLRRLLFNHFVNMCCRVQAVSSLHNFLHFLLLTTSVQVYVVKHLTWIQAVTDSILTGTPTTLINIFSRLSQSLCVNAGHSTPFRLRPPSISHPVQFIFLLIIFIFDATCCDLVTASLNKPTRNFAFNTSTNVCTL